MTLAEIYLRFYSLRVFIGADGRLHAAGITPKSRAALEWLAANREHAINRLRKEVRQ